jgi:hypothetical protein
MHMYEVYHKFKVHRKVNSHNVVTTFFLFSRILGPTNYLLHKL